MDTFYFKMNKKNTLIDEVRVQLLKTPNVDSLQST